MKIGIDKIGFNTSSYYLDLTDLANARGVDPNKYLIGIGQEKQAVVLPTQDIVTMGTMAADQMLTDADRQTITTVIVATESGIDNSKASAIYVKTLLGLGDFVRTIEFKEACYAGTAAIQAAKGLVSANPEEHVLVIAADIARYGLNTPGEVTQGGGAVAMLVTANPRILSIEGPSVPITRDVMDFWRPLGKTEAIVDGKYSTNVYIEMFLEAFKRYQELTDDDLTDFTALAFHLPFTKMGKKALEALLGDEDSLIAEKLRAQLTASQILNRKVGNLYTGSLYLSLISLLINGELAAGEKIGLFSYGSGAEGEFYTVTLQAGFETAFDKDLIESNLETRTKISVAEYEAIFNSQLGMNSEDIELNLDNDISKFRLTGIQNQKRIYTKK
ncbi:hydroxymethylglutaryl-CoA synthase [Paucilactobacillus oligofermentans DSM 15707 = LMG 22743]|uniref:Hydroxymethylglutaryl-CoA synthase n=1 Tax=Paucilactobacillus oligofermentans DSM 15707 = LMG 22743 TaxID=1423778 RepID=A0A0R1RIR5_9LACO|nr:hydroxymethylglutaryl-CoA synthase [Paucilactobacillus oligofermentans]KRL54698.1 hydroxymethylglutaryl-CoA synthase [Paucilactobacillus oligofermentans DSM 15707 = LMG 22743]CUS26391.1 Hydroxymethylglutaryl-CoA synthase [Paucilactobacillus oligofermentans DSM 15707 = LMG 22743]